MGFERVLLDESGDPMFMTTVAGDRIRKLRAVGGMRDPLAIRLALERALSGGDLHPGVLPRDAIVCVRRLRVSVSRFGSNEWEDATDRQLTLLLPNLIRPYKQTVPANSPVVAFADIAELLACMARDWLSGESDSWWWHSIVGTSLSFAVVKEAFSAKPAAVPAAIELLADSGLAARFASAMTEEWCGDVCASVASHFAVPALAPVAIRREINTSRREITSGLASDLVMRVRAVVAGIDGYDDLSDGRRMLVGLALLLRRAPASVRRAEIAEALLSRTQPVAIHSELFPRGDTSRVQGPRQQTDIAGSTSFTNDDASDNRRATITPRVVPNGAAPAHGDGEMKQLAASLPVAESRRLAARDPAPGEIEEMASFNAPDRGSVIHIDTSYAGVFYLVNVALHLGLYGDFSQPLRPGLSLPLGDFLALIGRGVCGTAIQRDPLWGLLDALSGSSSGTSAAEYEPETTLEARDETILADVAGMNGLRESWLDPIISMMASRAARGLCVPEKEALELLCSRPGRVSLSDNRLDAVFDLATHPLAIRLAGLDRNPGWVPAAGRVIEFRYE
jgi:hypothetical protein